jgi:hypothetical protein
VTGSHKVRGSIPLISTLALLSFSEGGFCIQYTPITQAKTASQAESTIVTSGRLLKIKVEDLKKICPMPSIAIYFTSIPNKVLYDPAI